MSTSYKNKGPIYLTQAKYDALKNAAALVAGQEYRIIDWEAQGKLTAGNNISIDVNNVISAVDTVYTTDSTTRIYTNIAQPIQPGDIVNHLYFNTSYNPTKEEIDAIIDGTSFYIGQIPCGMAIAAEGQPLIFFVDTDGVLSGAGIYFVDGSPFYTVDSGWEQIVIDNFNNTISEGFSVAGGNYAPYHQEMWMNNMISTTAFPHSSQPIIGVNTNTVALKTDITAEANARTAADTALQANITAAEANITAEANARTAADTALQANINTKQDILISGNNIKTINNNSLLGSGNIAVETYQPFPSTWVKSGTLEQVVMSMLDDPTYAKQGMAYLGGIEGSCTPFGYGNVECTVTFLLDYIAVLSVSSSNISPYRWEYNTAAGDFIWRKWSNVSIVTPTEGASLATGISIDGTQYKLADATAIQANITAEANARAAADTTLQNNIEAAEENIALESNARITEDTALQANIANLATGKLDKSPDGTNNLIDGNNKINTKYIPDAILGQMLFGGSFDSNGIATISSNLKSKLGISDVTIQLVNSATDDKTAAPKEYGYKTLEAVYFLADASFTIAGMAFEVGDWLVSIGTAWKKIDNTDAVTSVNGRTGAVVIPEMEDLTFDATGWTEVEAGVKYTKTVTTAKHPVVCYNSSNEVVFVSLSYNGTNVTITAPAVFAGHVLVI